MRKKRPIKAIGSLLMMAALLISLVSCTTQEGIRWGRTLGHALALSMIDAMLR